MQNVCRSCAWCCIVASCFDRRLERKSAGIKKIKNGARLRHWTPRSSTTDSTVVHCNACDRRFSRIFDMAHHKCVISRQLPVSDRPGLSKCPRSHRLLRSTSGRPVHRCNVPHADPVLVPLS